MSERRTLVKNISIKPVDVRESDGKKILDFLNKSDAKEIASKVEIIGEKDVGIKTATDKSYGFKHFLRRIEVHWLQSSN
jgi:hypothetical protein